MSFFLKIFKSFYGKLNSLVYKIIVDGYGKVIQSLTTIYINFYIYCNEPIDRQGKSALDYKLDAMESWMQSYSKGEVYIIDPETYRQFLVYMCIAGIVVGTYIFLKVVREEMRYAKQIDDTSSVE